VEKLLVRTADKANPFPKGIPGTFAGLCRVHLPRVIHDHVEFENAREIMQALAGFDLNGELVTFKCPLSLGHRGSKHVCDGVVPENKEVWPEPCVVPVTILGVDFRYYFVPRYEFFTLIWRRVCVPLFRLREFELSRERVFQPVMKPVHYGGSPFDRQRSSIPSAAKFFL